jgi:hypothetical protein
VNTGDSLLNKGSIADAIAAYHESIAKIQTSPRRTVSWRSRFNVKVAPRNQARSGQRQMNWQNNRQMLWTASSFPVRNKYSSRMRIGTLRFALVSMFCALLFVVLAFPQTRSPEYSQLQQRLARGWNTWDTNSMTTQVLLPDGLAIHIGFKHNATVFGDEFLERTSVGQGTVFPGPHAWDGSYTQLKVTWRGHEWHVESAHDEKDLVLLVTPLDPSGKFALPATAIFSVDFLWDRVGTALKEASLIQTRGSSGIIPVYCACEEEPASSSRAHDSSFPRRGQAPVSGAYFAAELTQAVGVSTGKRRSVAAIQAILEREHAAYLKSINEQNTTGPILDAIETTVGWDTIYDPEHDRVISPVSRDWSISWGGYALFGWDTFFGAALAGVGDKDLAYANAIEELREQTPQGFVPNYARGGDWKSFDRSEPPVGAITVLGLYRRFQDRWFLHDALEPLLRWNRWWDQHRSIQGFIVLGSNGENWHVRTEDSSPGTWQAALYESGLDNSPMYDGTFYDPKTHLLEYADVGMTSLYIADCDALAEIADVLRKAAEAKELRGRAARYRASLGTLWDDKTGIFLNRNLHTGEDSTRLSPTNFYPMLSKVATPAQAKTMIEKHLLNPDEFWGEWVIPSIARNDPAFQEQNYWRGRIWGPMNYLVYLGLRNYDDSGTRRDFAHKSCQLFLKEWREKGHVHENYNAIQGTGDDVSNSDRFYHWGALLGLIALEESSTSVRVESELP